MLSPAQIEQFQREGFIKGSRVLSDEQVEILCAETLRVIDDYQNGIQRERVPVRVANISGKVEAPVWQIVNIWEGSPAFEELLHNPLVVEETAQLMQAEMQAREIRLFHDQIQFKPAAIGGVNMWHQDSPYWPILTPKDVQLTAWIALDDADADNGCMSMVPGSHRWGDQIPFLHSLKNFEAMPENFEDKPLEVRLCPVEKGRVHFHHPLTWHGSQANTSGRPRRAIALHFMTERALFDANGSHPMKPFVESGPNETVRGQHFPLVWQG
ncbi:MAG TPA: phytanoyl-CoA dioxygenase family protein [Abditibacteriaceae bacterium]|jgi:ectoine hydroxylase-related dioxygenase (phytanoyl-CoA dioxygenase family)